MDKKKLLVKGIAFSILTAALLLAGCTPAPRLGEFPVGPGKVDQEWQEDLLLRSHKTGLRIHSMV